MASKRLLNTQTSTTSHEASPFHVGEQALQEKVGKREVMEAFGRRVIRDHMPEQHRTFFTEIPFLVMGAVDAQGNPWATLLGGPQGFITSAHNKSLEVSVGAPIQGPEVQDPQAPDPVLKHLHPGAPVGALGIELVSRRRNRMNGRIARLDQTSHTTRFEISVDQSFGNCPQYIQARDLEYVPERVSQAAPQRFSVLPADATALIEQADTLFVASAAPSPVEASDQDDIYGVDVSHRGGQPGFVHVAGNTLTIPDFPGNNHFNTFGNFLLNPKAGLVFVDFEAGDLLQLTGSVELLDADDAAVSQFRGATGGFRVHITEGQWLREALPFRFARPQASPNNALTDNWAAVASREQARALSRMWSPHEVVRIEDETPHIRSFYLRRADGGEPLEYTPGQHLPIRIDHAGQSVLRTYTLSSAPTDNMYRISVKREPQGAASNFLHDRIRAGDKIQAKGPKGTFKLDADSNRHILLIGAGVGITPMIAMAAHVVNESFRTRTPRPTTVLQVARTTKDMAFQADFRTLAERSKGYLRYLTVASSDTDMQADLNGHIGTDTLRQALPLDNYDVYLCGPGGFMQSAYDALRALNVPDAQIYAEAFGPSSLQRDQTHQQEQTNEVKPSSLATEASSATIKFADSQVTSTWEQAGPTILEVAEENGLNPDFSCREGACGTCATAVTQGAVFNRMTGEVVRAGEEALICCSVPADGCDRLSLQI